MVDGLSVANLSAAPRKRPGDQSPSVARICQNLWVLAKPVGIPSIIPMGVERGDTVVAWGLIFGVLDIVFVSKKTLNLSFFHL